MRRMKGGRLVLPRVLLPGLATESGQGPRKLRLL